MIIEEASWIRQLIDRYRPQSILNVGASTRDVRTIYQPYIESILFRGLQGVVHMDSSPGDGIDLVADVCDAKFSLPSKYDLVLCNSVLEHVYDRTIALRNVVSTVDRHLCISVPYEWEYHAAPIDTMYRPTLEQVVWLARKYEFDVSHSELLVDGEGRGKLAIVWGTRP